MIIEGDCIEKMKELDDNSVDAIVTDPPYGLGFMGKEWDELPPGKDVFEQCLRVLKPGGHLLSFGGTRTYHRMAVAIEDAGFEIRDMIEWVYGSGFPKSHNIGKAVDKKLGNEREVVDKKVKKAGDMRGGNFKRGSGYPDIEIEVTKGTSEWEGWGTALKPAHEPICMAMKPREGTFANNVLKYGVGGINIDESRVEGKHDGDPNRFAKTDGGWGVAEFHEAPVVRNEGRFPANLIHDNSDEVRECFPDESERYFKSIKYCPKASKKERNKGLENNNHPTVKPLELMEYLINMVTREGQTVLDPFMGSGTTGMACKKLGRDFIGIELNEDYIKIAEARIKATQEKLIKQTKEMSE